MAVNQTSSPAKEVRLLRSLTKSNGVTFIVTQVWDPLMAPHGSSAWLRSQPWWAARWDWERNYHLQGQSKHAAEDACDLFAPISHLHAAPCLHLYLRPGPMDLDHFPVTWPQLCCSLYLLLPFWVHVFALTRILQPVIISWICCLDMYFFLQQVISFLPALALFSCRLSISTHFSLPNKLGQHHCRVWKDVESNPLLLAPQTVQKSSILSEINGLSLRNFPGGYFWTTAGWEMTGNFWGIVFNITIIIDELILQSVKDH